MAFYCGHYLASLLGLMRIMKDKIITILLFTSCLSFLSFSYAANPSNVVINEIAWMGTEISYNDEWIVATKQHSLYS